MRHTILILAFTFPYLIFAQSFADYKKLNDAETRLVEFKDSDEMLRLKVAQLEIINESRRKYKANPVALDIHASRVANKQSKEAAEGGFRGHWNLRGEKPYHRYAFAGGTDHVSENAAATWIEGNTFDGKLETHAKLMEDLHGQFMAERTPNDGHKQTVIQKDHNFVGIGCHMTNTDFRYYEEFIDRYVEVSDVPASVKRNQEITITIKPLNNLFLYYGVAYFEKDLDPMTAKEVIRQGSYSDYSNDTAIQFAPWDLAEYRNESGLYQIPISFSKSGLYYIQFMVNEKDPSNLSSYNTKGQTVATGIVVRVR
ncbi:MAG: CAP domain-containing protein [Cyclobacteriaceae bacterium]